MPALALTGYAEPIPPGVEGWGIFLSPTVTGIVSSPRYDGPDGQSPTIAGRTVTIWRREPDGEWKARSRHLEHWPMMRFRSGVQQLVTEPPLDDRARACH